jgi:hypothetical protein
MERHKLKFEELDDVQLTEYEQDIYDAEACKHFEYCEQIKHHGRVIRDLR